jgi:hypothetical protein
MNCSKMKSGYVVLTIGILVVAYVGYALSPVGNTTHISERVIGTAPNPYWIDWIEYFQTLYGYSRIQAIDHFVDMIHDAGFNHVRSSLFAGEADETVRTLVSEISNRCHQLDMTFSLVFDAVYYSTDVMGAREQKVKAILNYDGFGDLWRNAIVEDILHFNADGVSILNEPVDWDSYVSYYNQDRFPSFSTYVGMSNQSDFFAKYHSWLLGTVAAIRNAKSGTLIIIDSMPFYDSRKWATEYLIKGSDIAYSVHDYYAVCLTWGQPIYRQWELDYWNNNLVAAKNELYAEWNDRLHGPLLEAGATVFMEELGANWVDAPNWKQFMTDAIQYNIQRNCSFDIYDFVRCPPEKLGMLTEDSTALNEYGLWIENHIKNLGSALIGDITGPDGQPDGKCDMRDLGLVARNFGRTVPPAPANCDITGPTALVPDGIIDMRDIGLIARHFGESYQ